MNTFFDNEVAIGFRDIVKLKNLIAEDKVVIINHGMDVPDAIIIQKNPDYDGNPDNDCWLKVIEDMHKRREFGIKKYGTPLQLNNSRGALVDAYQEELDKVVYMKQAVEQINFVNEKVKKLNQLIDWLLSININEEAFISSLNIFLNEVSKLKIKEI